MKKLSLILKLKVAMLSE